MKRLFLILAVLFLLVPFARADSKTSGLTELTTTPAVDDLVQIVDVSDTTMAASGTNKKITAKTLLAPPVVAGGSSSVSAPYEYYICTGTCTITPPTPVAGFSYQFGVFNDTNVATVITLEAVSGVQYENSGRTALCTANHQMKSGGAVGDSITLVSYGTGVYYSAGSKGTWTCQ
jgi:hypothetical protein